MRVLSHAIAVLVLASLGACREQSPTPPAKAPSSSASRGSADEPVGISHIDQIPASAVASFTADAKGRLKTVTFLPAAPVAVTERPVFEARFDASGKMLWWTPVLTDLPIAPAQGKVAGESDEGPGAHDD